MTEVDYNIQSAAQPWSLTHPNSSTLRFELRPEDHWASDYSTAVQRTEIIMHNNGNVQLFQAGTPLEITYNFRIEPGPATTAYFTTLGQMHAESDGVPPYYIQLTPGDHMEVTLGNGTPQNHHFWNAYVDPNPLIRDHTYSMKIDTNFATDSSGYLYVWRDGVQIVNYHGPIGYGDATYWKEGIYRAVDPGNQTIAVDYSNLKITTPTDSYILTGTTVAPSLDPVPDPIPSPPDTPVDPTHTDTGTGTSTGDTGSGTGGTSSTGTGRHKQERHGDTSSGTGGTSSSGTGGTSSSGTGGTSSGTGGTSTGTGGTSTGDPGAGTGTESVTPTAALTDPPLANAQRRSWK